MTGKEKNEDERHVDSPLTKEEEQDVRDHQSLSSVSLYAVIHREGLEELERPGMSLWWSGVAAGIGISTSVLAEGILHTVFEGSDYQFALENFGYTVGFVLVIMAGCNCLLKILSLSFYRCLTTALSPCLAVPQGCGLSCLPPTWRVLYWPRR